MIHRTSCCWLSHHCKMQARLQKGAQYRVPEIWWFVVFSITFYFLGLIIFSSAVGTGFLEALWSSMFWKSILGYSWEIHGNTASISITEELARKCGIYLEHINHHYRCEKDDQPVDLVFVAPFFFETKPLISGPKPMSKKQLPCYRRTFAARLRGNASRRSWRRPKSSRRVKGCQ